MIFIMFTKIFFNIFNTFAIFNILTAIKFLAFIFITRNIFIVVKTQFYKINYKIKLCSIKNIKSLFIDWFLIKKYKLLKKLNSSFSLCENEAVVCSSFNHW